MDNTSYSVTGASNKDSKRLNFKLLLVIEIFVLTQFIGTLEKIVLTIFEIYDGSLGFSLSNLKGNVGPLYSSTNITFRNLFINIVKFFCS